MKHDIENKKDEVRANVGDVFQGLQDQQFHLCVENELQSGTVTMLNLSTDRLTNTSNVGAHFKFVGVAHISLMDKGKS
jgi:hypothetical protein